MSHIDLTSLETYCEYFHAQKPIAAQRQRQHVKSGGARRS